MLLIYQLTPCAQISESSFILLVGKFDSGAASGSLHPQWGRPQGQTPSGVRAPQECREGLMHVCGSDGWH